MVPDAGSWTAACAGGCNRADASYHRRPDPGDHAEHEADFDGLVRFDNGVRCDAKRLADAAHKLGEPCCCSMPRNVRARLPMNVADLGADFRWSSGYKWLLGPYGTGFFWASAKRMAARKCAMPAYWMVDRRRVDFSKLSQGTMKLKKEARRWDTPETANFFNLAPLEASLDFLARAGVQTVWEHNQRLMAQLSSGCRWINACWRVRPMRGISRAIMFASRRGKPERTRRALRKLRAAGVIVSLREGSLRICSAIFIIRNGHRSPDCGVTDLLCRESDNHAEFLEEQTLAEPAAFLKPNPTNESQ